MGSVGTIASESESNGDFSIDGINMNITVENDEQEIERVISRQTDYPIEIVVGGFRVIHDHDEDDNPVYYVYDDDNTLVGEVNSTSRLHELVEELRRR